MKGLFTSRTMSVTLTAFLVAAGMVFIVESQTNVAGNHRALRIGTLDVAEDELYCQITLIDMQIDTDASSSTASGDYFECSPVHDNIVSDGAYRIELAGNLIISETDQRLLHGELFVSVSGASIQGDDVVLSNDAVVTIVSPPTGFVSHRRSLIAKTGTLSLLVLRISTTDSSPSLSADEYHQLIFEDDISLKKQYEACSFGKLNLEPTEHRVMDLFVNAPAAGATAQSLINLANVALRERLDIDKVTQAADMIAMIMPPGTNGDWAAFSGVNHYRSVYNDLWGGYQTSLMHEIGHGLGLGHSNEGGHNYADFTGYMSAGHKVFNSPAKCFNGQNHWHLGWYDDRSISVDPVTPQLLKIAAFVEYDKTVEGEYVVAEVGDLYMQYNRAKGFNAETEEKVDMLTVVAKMDGGTDMVAGLDSNQAYTAGDLTIHVCQVGQGGDYDSGDSQGPDYMVVSVGNGPSLCATKAYSAPNFDENEPVVEFGEDGIDNANDENATEPQYNALLLATLALAIAAVLSAIVTVVFYLRCRKTKTIEDPTPTVVTEDDAVVVD